MIFRLVSAESNKLPPGPVRHFGGSDPYKVVIKWETKSSYIPKRKDKASRQKQMPKAKSPPASTEELKIVEPAVATKSELPPQPDPSLEPEPPRVPLVPMSRQAWNKTLKNARKVAASAPGAGTVSYTHLDVYKRQQEMAN